MTLNRGCNLSELNFFPYIWRTKFLLYRVVVKIREDIFIHSFYIYSLLVQVVRPRYYPRL